MNLVNRFGMWKDNAAKLRDAVWGLTVTFLQMWEASKTSAVNYMSSDHQLS